MVSAVWHPNDSRRVAEAWLLAWAIGSLSGCATATAPAPRPQPAPPAIVSTAAPAPTPAGQSPEVVPPVTTVAAVPAAPLPQAESIALPSSTAALATELQSIISRPGVRRATWGVVVHSLAGHGPLLEHNADTLLVPASVSKLVSVAAAIEAVGWDYTFTTNLVASGPIVDGVLRGDLIVIGSGNPSIGGRGGDDLGVWVDGLKAAGIRRITGRIIGDDDAFEEPRPGAMWAWDDLGYTSGALFGALNFAENRMTVTVTPGAPGMPATLSVEPFAVARPLINRTMTVAPGATQLIWPEQRPGETALTIAGTISAGAASGHVTVSAGNPTLWLARALRSRLERGGIVVGGDAVDIDDLPVPLDRTSARVVFSHRSRPLAEIVEPLLKESINIYAEAMLRLTTGATGERTNDAALAAIRARLSTWGLPQDALQVVDGSGLSRRDAVAAGTLVAVLERMFDPTGASPWMKALPIAARDGTLDNRFKGTAAEANLTAKTGTMSNIRSLAGYVRTRDGEPLAFAILVNNFEGTGAQAQAAIDAIAVRLAEFKR